jgi:SAM-dependent methyltransferase
MSSSEGAVLDRALRRARAAAFAPGEFVGQESFVGAGEVLALAGRAGVTRGTRVLDVCCGSGGPGRLVTRELGCSYLGVDASPQAVARARRLAAGEGLGCRFRVARVPPLPPGAFDVVMLLETMLAFRDKVGLFRAVASTLPDGGRFAFTLEEGRPLTSEERRAMPLPDTVWPAPFPDVVADLERAGLRLRWHEDRTAAHRVTVDALVGAYAALGSALAAGADGRRTVEDLVAGHALWRRWLGTGRVRKLAVVAEKVP